MKGKDKIISEKNREIERLQQQLDSLSHGKDSHIVSLKEIEVLLKEKENTIAQFKDIFLQTLCDSLAMSYYREKMKLFQKTNQELKAKNSKLQKLVQEIKK